MKASYFISLWKDFSKSCSEKENLLLYWENDSSWTEKFLYRKNSDNKFLLQEIIQKHCSLKDNEEPPDTRFEYRKIDFVIFSPEKYTGINNYDNSGTIAETDHPRGLEAIVEHENDYRMIFQEVRKLNEIKAKLKVLITYPPDQNSIQAIIEKMRKGIKQSNEYFQENTQTVYLLILGYNRNNEIEWEFCTFNVSGDIMDAENFKPN